ncbi:MAG: SPASM domain-containing protein [Methylobacteriaceae bacterium]|nr:SPASM domain-containing protein [Methylobacteriaceae bacterium]
MTESEHFQFCKNNFICNDMTTSFANWNGLISDEDLPQGTSLIVADNTQKEQNCALGFLEMTVVSNGDMVGCGCFDASGDTVVGNVEHTHLKNIFTGEAYRKFRHSFALARVSHTISDIPRVCRTCAFYRPLLNELRSQTLADYDFRRNYWDTRYPPAA